MNYCQWKRRRERLSKDQFHPSVWCLFTFDWLHLTGWGMQLQLLLTELTGVATWCHLMVGIDATWCHLLVATCWYWPLLSASLLPLQLASITLGRCPSEASCCFCPLLCLVYIPVLLSWDGTRELLQFNFSPLMLQITAFGCWWRRKFTWNCYQNYGFSYIFRCDSIS